MAIKMSRRARWAVPATAVAVTAAVVAGLQIPSAQASPTLPARSAAQLLAEVGTDASLPPLTGTMVETTDLGLPQLPQVGNATSLSSMLTGSHTMKIYYQDATQFRVSIPQPESEIDLIRKAPEPSVGSSRLVVNCGKVKRVGSEVWRDNSSPVVTP